MCRTCSSEVGGGWGGSTDANVEEGLLSGGGVGVGEPGVGLAGGGLAAAVSGARPVDPETDFFRGVFFFFFAMTAVLQAIPVQSGSGTGAAGRGGNGEWEWEKGSSWIENITSAQTKQ